MPDTGKSADRTPDPTAEATSLNHDTPHPDSESTTRLEAAGSPANTEATPRSAGDGSTGTAATTDPLRQSRTSSTWVALVAFGLLLVLLIIFVLQNTQRVQVTYLGLTATAPLSVALLVAVAGGILVTAIAGTLRILQLRRRVRREVRRTRRGEKRDQKRR